MINIRNIYFLIILLLLSSCSHHSNEEAQGYIEGRYTYMATSVSGVLKELLVARGSQVKKDQTLFILEEQPESDAYEAAVENLKQSISARDAISANLAYAKITFERNKVLVPKKAVSQSALDSARSSYEALNAQLIQANANIAAAVAQLAQARWTKNQKVITAPLDAIVFDTYYRVGEYTKANEAIISLLAPSDIKAIFYVSEKYLGGIQLGDKISLHCDGCQKRYVGHVSFISPSAEYTPPVIYSNETSIKLIYRIEAEFAPQDAIHLHPGQPVIVTFKPRS